MRQEMVTLEARGIAVTVNPRLGMIEEVKVSRDGRTVAPLHKAPWRNEANALPKDAAPHLAQLAGDFFCAPFGDASADNAPAHGWSANSEWDLLGTKRVDGKTFAMFKLVRRVRGAELTKMIRLEDDHPFVYQRHVFEGGEGTLAAANHAMVALPNGGHLRFSPKRWWETPATGLETDPARGRSHLRYPAQSDDPSRFPLADGREADLTRYPFSERHEDFAVGIEAEGSRLGWSSVWREQEGDLFLSLRNPKQIPMTMLWFSNGGRDYAPWNSRHHGVLGVEEGLNRALLGSSALSDPHPLDTAGVPTGIELDPTGMVEMRHVIGVLPWTWQVEAIEPGEGTVRIRTAGGETRTVPCDVSFLGLDG